MQLPCAARACRAWWFACRAPIRLHQLCAAGMFARCAHACPGRAACPLPHTHHPPRPPAPWPLAHAGPWNINKDLTLTETKYGWDVHAHMIFVVGAARRARQAGGQAGRMAGWAAASRSTQKPPDLPCIICILPGTLPPAHCLVYALPVPACLAHAQSGPIHPWPFPRGLWPCTLPKRRYLPSSHKASSAATPALPAGPAHQHGLLIQ